jgi:threonine dehydrogenase-like Zn-dependent dehydrogenase
MKSTFFFGGSDIRIQDVPTPSPKQGEVLIEIRSAGICGSDLHKFTNRIPLPEIPLEQGHELSGVVMQVGEGVGNLKPGDRVGIEAEHLIGCGKCQECNSGNYHVCLKRGIIDNKSHFSHGFSSHDIVYAQNCYKLPDHVNFDHAAILDCYACGVHAVNRTPVNKNNVVVILGAGAIALTLGQIVKAYGAGRVIMIGTRINPLEIALSAGSADEYIINSNDDPINEVMKSTSGLGADIVFETVGGNSQLLDQCMQMAGIRKTVSILGGFTSTQYLQSQEVGMKKELNITWSNSYSTWDGISEYQQALDLLSQGKLNPEPIITHRFNQSDIQKGFEAANNKKESAAIKVMINHNISQIFNY